VTSALREIDGSLRTPTNRTKYHYLGDRLVATWILGAPQLSEVDPAAPLPVSPPAPLPAQLVYPVAAMALLLLFLPFGGQRRLGVRISFARSASVSLILLTGSAPVVFVAGCTTTPAVRLLHVDHLGSTQVVTDWGGNIVRQMRYTAYGEIRGRFGPNGFSVAYGSDTRFEFTGYESDFAGLEYAGARFFDPELAQFASHDPAGQFASPYAYGPGDPMNGTDPTGTDFGISGLIIAFILSLAAQAVIRAIDTGGQIGNLGAQARADAQAFAAAKSLSYGNGLVESTQSHRVGLDLENYAMHVATEPYGDSTIGKTVAVLAFKESSEAVSGADSASSQRDVQANSPASNLDQNPFDPKDDPFEHEFWQREPTYRDQIRRALEDPGKHIPTHDWTKDPEINRDRTKLLVHPFRYLGWHVPPNFRYGRLHLTYEFDSGLHPFLHIDATDPTENFSGHFWESLGLGEP
jgi:RHS repeat-associated protein